MIGPTVRIEWMLGKSGLRRRMAAWPAVTALALSCWCLPARALGEAPQTIAELRHAAESGDARAQFSLAMKLWRPGTASPEALEWCRKAAEQGYLPAQIEMAITYQTGMDGVTANQAAALFWHRRAAEQGFVDSQLFVGDAYAEGKGVTRDDAEAVSWYLMALGRGDGWAEYELGRMIEAGRGVAKDEGKAAQLYRTAADLNQPLAQLALARLQVQGSSIVRNPTCAYLWYSLVVKYGDKVRKLLPPPKPGAAEPNPILLPLEQAAEERDALARTLTPSELAEGKRLAAAATIEGGSLPEHIRHPLCPRDTITVAVSQVPLRELVSRLQTLTGLAFAVPPQADLQVTADLHDVPWETALTEILQHQGYRWAREGDLIRLEALPAPPR
ncbi:MAG TPA: hypothetical protein VHB47_09240 [Thermoanaerobaculia bacterium]|jgi:hypothetical protein|nr:hypothetical protein [Thermoanaerobaculia bacterium]